MSVPVIHVLIADDQKTGTAVDGPALTRVEGNRCCCLAACAVGTNLDTVAFAGRTGKFDSLKADILSFLTLFTAFGRVLEVFVAKERLFPYRPDKFLFAVNTGDRRVGEFAAGFR